MRSFRIIAALGGLLSVATEGLVPVLGVLPMSVRYQVAAATVARIKTTKIRHERREF